MAHQITLLMKIIPILEVLICHHPRLCKIDIRNTGIPVLKEIWGVSGVGEQVGRREAIERKGRSLLRGFCYVHVMMVRVSLPIFLFFG